VIKGGIYLTERNKYLNDVMEREREKRAFSHRNKIIEA
jgi:hypothetical protein